jgi:hypothetical protein
VLKLSRISFALYAALLAATTPTPATAEETLERLKREATKLFQSVVKHEAVKRDRCSLDSEWLDHVYSVPYEVAKQHFGLTIHADLVATDHATKPAEVIDPAGTMTEAFCNDEDATKRTNALREEFKRGSLTENGHLGSRLWITRIGYSFPVFDRDYKRAIIVVSASGRGAYKTPDGGVRGYPAEGQLSVEVYIKRKGVWRFLAREVLGQT